MNSVLSQAEIDQLLSAIAAGDDDVDDFKPVSSSHKIKIYDFMRPDVFSREQLRTVSNVSEVFGRAYTKQLTLQLKRTCRVHICSVDQLTFEEFIRAIPTPSEMNVATAKIDNKEYSIITEFDPAVAFTMLGLTADEPDNKKKAKAVNRDLTDDEITKWEKTYVNPFLSTLKNAFRVGFDSNIRSFTNKKTENNPQFINVVSPTSMGVLITFEAIIGNNEGMMNIFLPADLAQKLSDDYNGIVRPDKLPFNVEKFETSTKLPVKVSLGTAQKTIKEIKGFGEGTIIELDKFAGEPVDIEVDGNIIAKGEVVVIDENFGVRIVELV